MKKISIGIWFSVVLLLAVAMVVGYAGSPGVVSPANAAGPVEAC